MPIFQRTISLTLAVVCASLCSLAQNAASAPAKAHILVLGSFHMANPGKDMYNLQVDDVRSPKRQAEIAAFVESIKPFRPTKIALEVALGDAQLNQNYQGYFADKYTLTASESEQIGFRLAKELGHKQVYPINVMGDFPFDPVAEFAKKNGKEQLLNDLMSSAPQELDKQARILKTGTIGDLYRYINSEEQVRKGQAIYMSMARFAGNGEYPGPDLLAEWYRRNVRIFSNLRNIIDSPDDRVLVIYGAGHEYWLQRDVLDSDDLMLERLSDYIH